MYSVLIPSKRRRVRVESTYLVWCTQAVTPYAMGLGLAASPTPALDRKMQRNLRFVGRLEKSLARLSAGLTGRA